MRLYRDSNEYLCLWCGATREECLDAPVESTALKCCPDCDHGIEVVPVPWCETHNEPMVPSSYDDLVPRCQLGYDTYDPDTYHADKPCRLQDPPKVWRQLDE